MTDTLLSLEDMQEILDDVVFKPFGQEGWHFVINRHDKEPGVVMLTLVNSFARDAREFDFGAEEDDWTLMDGREQTFTERQIGLAICTEKELYAAVAHLTSYAFAHEALEWLRRWGPNNEAIMLHDPHKDGDVLVKL